MQARAVLILALALGLPVISGHSYAGTPIEKHWQRVMSGESKVGLVEHTRRVEGDRVFLSEVTTLELGTSSTRQTYRSQVDFESSADGSLLRALRESKTPEGHTLIDAHRSGDELHISIGAGKARHRRKLTGAATLKSEDFARSWLKAAGSGKAQGPLQFQTFDANRLAIVEVELRGVVGADAPPYLVKRVVRAAGRETEVLLTLNADGNVIGESMRLGATTLRLVGSTEAQARERGGRLNHVVAQMQKSPYRIPNRDMRAKIRYGFAHGGDAPVLPVGAGQRSWSDDQTTWIQVCASCPLDTAPLSDEERARSLAATPWLNFDDEALARRARREVHGAIQPARKMERLTNYVRGHMTAKQIDMLGYGSAYEAFKNRRGDCTEYAVLLAALGRAVGVPTRVVSGLVYARRFEGQRHVFVPHAWVHAWTGNGWESFDAGIGSFDSTHLAFAVSYDGNPSQLFAGLHLAHELELRSAARVVPAPVK